MTVEATSEGTSTQPRTRRPLDLAVAACLIGIAAFELFELHLHIEWAGLAAAVLLVAFLVLGQGRLGLRERYLLALAAAATLAAVAWSPSPLQLIQRGLGQATFLAAFMLLLSLLRDGAITSPSVLALGQYLTRRPPGQRYIAIHFGGHALGVVLNFGALSLLGPLIQRGVETDAKDNPELAQWRLRRQMSALARGFSWIIAWSPTAVTQALVASVVAGSKPLLVGAIGFVAASGVFVIGWAADRVTGKQARASLSRSDALPRPDLGAKPFPWAAFGRFALVCGALAAISVVLILFTGARVIPALMLASPIVTAVWVWFQFHATPDGVAAVLARLKDIASVSIPAGSPEAVTLSSAGYIGIVAAGLVNPPALAEWTGIAGVAPVAAYIGVMTLVPLLSNLAIPPMLTVTFLGSLYSALPDSHLEPTLLAASMALGWALNLTASPFGATALILSRITGIPGTTLSWKWNTGFTLAAWAWAGAVLFAASSLSAQ
jgi:hypothetical protein